MLCDEGGWGRDVLLFQKGSQGKSFYLFLESSVILYSLNYLKKFADTSRYFAHKFIILNDVYSLILLQELLKELYWAALLLLWWDFLLKGIPIPEELEKKPIFLKIEETSTMQSSEVDNPKYTEKRREKLSYWVCSMCKF